MTQYFTDFSEHSISDGLAQIDWSERWGSFSTVEIQDDGGSNVLRLTGPSGDARCVLTWDEVDSDANRATVEVLVLVENLSGDIARAIRTGSRVSGLDNSETGWTIGQQSSTNHRISNYDGGTFNDVANTAFSLGGIGTVWWLRTQSNGTAHKSKIWEDGTSEPGTWTLETIGTAVQSVGGVGLFLFDSTADVRIRQFGVGTGGDAAPSSGAAFDPANLQATVDGADATYTWDASF